jgi:hypothetical protein
MRGQASVEFLLILGIISVIFAIIVSYFAGYSLYSSNFLSEEGYRSICRQVSDEVEGALASGPDYERVFYLPQGNYNVSLYDREIRVNYSAGMVLCPTSINASKNLSIGKNTIIYNETGIYFR